MPVKPDILPQYRDGVLIEAALNRHMVPQSHRSGALLRAMKWLIQQVRNEAATDKSSR